MLLVSTDVRPSTIEGLGLFAREAIPAGAEVWRFAPGLDLLIRPDAVEALPAAFRRFLERYGYVSPDIPDDIVLSCDHAKFMNHSDRPNIESRDFSSYAIRAIEAGEEITCDYRAIVVGFEGF